MSVMPSVYPCVRRIDGADVLLRLTAASNLLAYFQACKLVRETRGSEEVLMLTTLQASAATLLYQGLSFALGSQPPVHFVERTLADGNALYGVEIAKEWLEENALAVECIIRNYSDHTAVVSLLHRSAAQSWALVKNSVQITAPTVLADRLMEIDGMRLLLCTDAQHVQLSIPLVNLHHQQASLEQLLNLPAQIIPTHRWGQLTTCL